MVQPPPDGPLVCPSCGASYSRDERFCADCGIPLVEADAGDIAPELSERQERARKIKPQLAEGELVRVAGARNQAEAEFIQGLLLEEGVPSMLRRTAGFDVPDFLAAGPRDILVPASGAMTAREVLLEADLISPAGAQAEPIVVAWKLLAGILIALAIGAVILAIGAR